MYAVYINGSQPVVRNYLPGGPQAKATFF